MRKPAWIVVLIMLFNCLLMTNSANASYSGWMGFESYFHQNDYPSFPCNSSYLLSDVSELQNTSMTVLYSPHGDVTWSGDSVNITSILAARLAIYAAVGYTTMGLGAVAMGITDLIMMNDVCRSTFVFQPAEYIAYSHDKLNTDTCSAGPPSNASSVLSYTVPYLYHCNKNYDLIHECTISADSDNENCANINLRGKTYGYGGVIDPSFCAMNAGGPNAIQTDEEAQRVIGKIIIGYYPGAKLWFKKQLLGNFKSCDTGEIDVSTIRIDDGMQWIGGAGIMPFMRYDTSANPPQLLICAAAVTTMLPVFIGCAPVPMPAEVENSDPNLLASIANSRCEYILSNRTDLQYLPTLMQSQGFQLGGALTKFLQSNFHPISTIVGCLQDMLIKIFVADTKDPTNPNNYSSAFMQIQDNFKGIVIASLTLFICMVGIKIMMTMGEMKKTDYIMLLMKFALVYYFTLGSAWQDIYPSILSAPNEIAGMFIDTFGTNDPRMHCEFDMQQDPSSTTTSNMLGEHLFPLGAGAAQNPPVNTIGYPNSIKVTIWDLVDCKLINYLNLGTCNYGLDGMITIFIAAASFCGSTSAFTLGMASLIYIALTLSMILRFVHVFVLSAFVVAILIFTSPIFLCFALFEKTKDIFQQWMKAILAYILYPALPFAYLALAFTTIDILFYGPIDAFTKCTDPSVECNLYVQCQTVDSVFCKMVVSDEPGNSTLCSLPANHFHQTFMKSSSMNILGDTFTTYDVNDAAKSSLMIVLTKMMFISFFFLIMADNILNFLAQLIGAQPFGDMSSTASFSIFSFLSMPVKLGNSLAKKVASQQTQGAKPPPPPQGK